MGAFGVKRVEMQKLGEKLADAGVVERPKKTTFADGTMATTEAYLYYKERCRDRGMDHISKLMFKWHLKHGQYLRASMAPNPFGKFPSKIYAISKEAVTEFVEELAQREDALSHHQKATPKATPQPTKVKVPSPPAPKPLPTADSKELMNATEAYEYLCKKATHRGTSINRTLFGFYLAYELIDSVFVGRARQVEKSSVDAFLELCPTGLYKKHIDYVVKPALEEGDLTMAEAYAYYKTQDKAPVALNSFRALAAAGIIVAIREKNKTSSPTLGFTKAEVDFFVRMRARIAAKNADAPAHKSFKTKTANREENEALDDFYSDAYEMFPKEEPPKEVAVAPLSLEGQREWVSIRDAYHYYCERVDQPLSEKWFAEKCYKSEPFESRCDVDKRRSNPSGKKYMVNLDSVDAFLQSKPETKPSQKSYPVDKAYHKFRASMPAGMTLIQFKRLIRNKDIKSFTRDGVARVRQADVVEYFSAHEKAPRVEKQEAVSIETESTEEEATGPIVTLSMSKFPTKEGLAAAVQALAEQGIRVHIEP